MNEKQAMNMKDNPTESKAVLKLWQGFLQKIPAAAALTTIEDLRELQKIVALLPGEESAFIEAGEKKAFRELIKSVTDKLHAAAIIEARNTACRPGCSEPRGKAGIGRSFHIGSQTRRYAYLKSRAKRHPRKSSSTSQAGRRVFKRSTQSAIIKNWH